MLPPTGVGDPSLAPVAFPALTSWFGLAPAPGLGYVLGTEGSVVDVILAARARVLRSCGPVVGSLGRSALEPGYLLPL
jgi:hypothetical protein